MLPPCPVGYGSDAVPVELRTTSDVVPNDFGTTSDNNGTTSDVTPNDLASTTIQSTSDVVPNNFGTTSDNSRSTSEPILLVLGPGSLVLGPGSLSPGPGGASGLHEFLAEYPKQTKRDATARAYVSIVESPEEHAALMAGLRRWLASDQWRRSLKADGGRFIPDPDKFIFERLYLDQPAAEQPDADTNDPVAAAMLLVKRKAIA